MLYKTSNFTFLYQNRRSHVDICYTSRYNKNIIKIGGDNMTTKLFERLVTKFSIKVTDLIKYLDVSKATIYNYRNLENFADIPKDKQLKILYLFGKATEGELELVLDESDSELLKRYLDRIVSILGDSAKNKKDALASLEELTAQNTYLRQENAVLLRQSEELKKFSGLDEFTRSVLFDKISEIVEGANSAEMKEFIDYLDIFAKYRKALK